MSYNSKYKSSEIEEILDSVEDKQNKITDLDTIRSGAAKGATALQSVPSGYATTSDLDNKVDKVSGKQLSTEDFTSALKSKLEGLSNYDDTELSEALSTLRGDFDKLVSGDTTTAIKTFNEVIAFLDGVQDTQDLSSIIASIEQQIAGKMDKVTLATVATSGSYNDLSNKPTIPSAVTESTVSGWGFTKNTGTYSKPSTGIPKSDLASAVQTSLGKADTALQSVPNTYATNEYVDNKLATTLEYYRTRFTFLELVEAKNSGGLIQEGGKAELAQAITLGKTIVVDYDSVSGAKGHILCNATLEGDEILLQVVFGNEHIVVSTFTDGDTIYPDDITYDTFVAESDFNDTIDGLNANKQDALVSGTNIKTINGQSIVGSGNITISGGGSSGGSGKEYVEAPILEEPMGAVISFSALNKLEPNKVYVATSNEVTMLYIGEDVVLTTSSLCDEYTIMFKAGGDGGAVLALPTDWIMANELPKLTGYVEVNIVRTTYQGNNVFKVVVCEFKPVE